MHLTTHYASCCQTSSRIFTAFVRHLQTQQAAGAKNLYGFFEMKMQHRFQLVSACFSSALS